MPFHPLQQKSGLKVILCFFQYTISAVKIKMRNGFYDFPKSLAKTKVRKKKD